MDTRQQQPTWSIEINENNINLFPQLTKEPFQLSIIERYQHSDDIFHKSMMDWFRDNPIINGEQFRPRNVELSQKEKRNYFLSKLTGDVTTPIIWTETSQKNEGKVELQLFNKPLTNDKELNVYFGCIAHQDLMQSPEPDLSRMLSLLSKSGDSQSIINSTLEPDTITHIKSFSINSFFTSTGKTVVEGNPVVRVIVTLEVYRDAEGVKHRYKYKLESYNKKADILLKKMLSPAYRLFAFLDDLNQLNVDGSLPASEDYYYLLNQIIDAVNQDIPNINKASSDQIFPKLDDTTWNVYIVLGQLKKLSAFFEEKIENEQSENNLLFIKRKKCLDEIHDKILTTYQNNLSDFQIPAIQDNLSRLIMSIFLKEIYFPQSENFNKTLKKVKALIESYKLINNKTETDEVIKEIIKEDVDDGQFNAITSIMAMKSLENDDALNLFQKLLIEGVKNTLLRKARKISAKARSSLALFIDHFEKSFLDDNDKNQLLLKLFNIFIQKDYAKFLDIELPLSIEADVQSSLNAYKAEINKLMLHNILREKENKIIYDELETIFIFHLNKLSKIIENEFKMYCSGLHHFYFETHSILNADKNPIEIINDHINFIGNENAFVVGDVYKMKNFVEHHPKLSQSIQKYIEINKLYKKLQGEKYENTFVHFKDQFIEFKHSVENHDFFIKQIDTVLFEDEKNLIEDISNKIEAFNLNLNETECSIAKEIMSSLQLKVELEWVNNDSSNRKLMVVRDSLPYKTLIEEIIHREQQENKVNLSKDGLQNFADLIKLMTHLALYVEQTIHNITIDFTENAERSDIISAIVTVLASKPLLFLDTLESKINKVSELALLLGTSFSQKVNDTLALFQNAIRIIKDDRREEYDKGQLVDHIYKENFINQKNLPIVLAHKRLVEPISFTDEQETFLDRIRSINSLNDACIKFKADLEDQMRKMLPMDLQVGYFNNGDPHTDPIMAINRDLNNQVESISRLVTDENRIGIILKNYLSLRKVQDCLIKGKKSPTSAHSALHHFELEFNKHKNIFKHMNCSSATTFLNSVIETQESAIILNNACKIFKEKLTSRIKDILSKEYLHLYIQYFSPSLDVKSDPILKIMNDIDNKQESISQIVDENREFRVSIQKYRAVTELKKTLSDRKSQPSEAVDKFEQKLHEHQKILKKPDDGLAMTFFRAIAKVFGFSWVTSTDEFFSNVGTLFPNSKKRIGEGGKQMNAENTKKSRGV